MLRPCSQVCGANMQKPSKAIRITENTGFKNVESLRKFPRMIFPSSQSYIEYDVLNNRIRRDSFGPTRTSKGECLTMLKKLALTGFEYEDRQGFTLEVGLVEPQHPREGTDSRVSSPYSWHPSVRTIIGSRF